MRISTRIPSGKTGGHREKEPDLYSMTLFIRDWVLNHIPNFDRPAADFFRMLPKD
jgi:hypothetical protein